MMIAFLINRDWLIELTQKNILMMIKIINILPTYLDKDRRKGI